MAPAGTPRVAVPRRPMTFLERVRALQLAGCRLPPASWSKRFAQDMAARAGMDEPAITEREALALERLCWTFRRLLAARGLKRLVPSQKPQPAPPRARPAPRPRPLHWKARQLKEKYDKAMRGEW